jgi:hypothetical protein
VEGRPGGAGAPLEVEGQAHPVDQRQEPVGGFVAREGRRFPFDGFSNWRSHSLFQNVAGTVLLFYYTSGTARSARRRRWRRARGRTAVLRFGNLRAGLSGRHYGFPDAQRAVAGGADDAAVGGARRACPAGVPGPSSSTTCQGRTAVRRQSLMWRVDALALTERGTYIYAHSSI